MKKFGWKVLNILPYLNWRVIIKKNVKLYLLFVFTIKNFLFMKLYQYSLLNFEFISFH